MMSLRPRISPLLAALVLAGCASSRQSSLEEPTLASLSAREPRLSADPGLKPTQEQVIAAYRQFIDVAVDVPQRAESLRRLGDLEMDSADRSAAQAAEAAAPDYKAARARYESFLKTYPKAPKTDRVLYQLARAQEQAGELETALKTLTQLVTEYPGTLHVGEAQFRRGEMLFATREYAQAEAAYDAVLRYERRGLPAEALPASPLVERALYMQGWSFFKLGRLDEALAAFFEVLDGKLAALPPVPREEVELQAIRQLTRADREWLGDAGAVHRRHSGAYAGSHAFAYELSISRLSKPGRALPEARTRERRGRHVGGFCAPAALAPAGAAIAGACGAGVWRARLPAAGAGGAA
jgi:tetratricopeptide (TPR) repeat protein